MEFILSIQLYAAASSIKGNYHRFPAESEFEKSTIVEMNNYLDERIIAVISDYMDLDSFNALRQSCTVYKQSCDEYSNLLTEANYFSLLQHARKYDPNFDISDIAQIKWIDKFPVNITDLHSLFDRKSQWIFQGIRLPEKLPFIAFSLFNQQNINERLYIVATFNGTRLQSLAYQIRADSKLQPLRKAKVFRDCSDNLDVIIDMIRDKRISNIFSFDGVSWIAKKTYFSRFVTSLYASKYVQSFIRCYKANEKKLKIGFILYSLYYVFWIIFIMSTK